ncbi:MAG TPA: type I DNA topoisomerase, partial [Myxococcaceae bacterium]|nr:type I DNA topoisomerase [Myxococcaceae bacterium]
DSGAAPAEKAKKPLGRKAAPAGKAKKAAPVKTAAKKRTLAVVHAGGIPAPRRGGRYLVVVESPAKAKTIKKYLGTGYAVKASVGHVKDLPKSKMGIDVEHDFKPEYHVIPSKEKALGELKKAAAGAEQVFLATDPDREGEAIAWHLNEELRHPNAVRVLFNEITKKAIQEAIAHPRALDQAKYDSQQTRRILDRLVGYQISPLLWEKVRRGLSAGRVQSVAVRLIVEREREIKAFVPTEYWTLEAELEGKAPPPFRARLAKLDGKKAEVADKATADALLEELRKADYQVATVERRERRRNAPAPFITSKLQQEAANRLHFTAKKTMTLAQRLYEGVELGDEGQTALITYMRTDSVRLSDDAVKAAREHIAETYGKDALPDEPMVYKSRKSAQDAHEAIRPVSMEWTPDRVRPFLEPDMARLYELIWNRFVACQMKPAVYDQTTVEISAGRATFRAAGSILKFAGYLAVYGMAPTTDEESDREKNDGEEKADEGNVQLPELAEGDRLRLVGQGLLSEQHFTQPPPRFTEASLVKELEEDGIGRPSTYASILSVIQEKKYVEKIEGRFHPTELGKITTEELVKHFPSEMDVTFTAGMEEQLDQISEGETDWRRVLRDFYGPFQATLALAKKQMRDVKREEIPTDVNCEKCGKMMAIKWGKMGRFLACTGYPDCKNTKDFKEVDGKVVPVEEEPTDETCEKCGRPMVIKRGRFGRFMACSGYPECKTSKPLSIGVACPTCKVGYLTERRSRRGKVFFGCNRYPDCTFAAWDRPLPETCPQCASPYLLQKYSKRDGARIVCPNKECGYTRSVDEGGTMAPPSAA